MLSAPCPISAATKAAVALQGVAGTAFPSHNNVGSIGGVSCELSHCWDADSNTPGPQSFTFCCTMRQPQGCGMSSGSPRSSVGNSTGSVCFRPPTMDVFLLELKDSGLQHFLLRLQVPHSGCFSEHFLFGATQCSEECPAHMAGSDFSLFQQPLC